MKNKCKNLQWFMPSNSITLTQKTESCVARGLIMELIIGIIILILGIILFGLFSRKKIYKEVDRLESWKIDIMNRPVTDEMVKVKELKMTGQTEELFERWREEWDEIITTQLPDVEELLFDAEEHADKYRFKKAKNVVRHIESMLQTVEETIYNILTELQGLVGSEEKNRFEIGELKQKYRDLKKTLLAHRHSFGKAEIRLEIHLDEATEKFKLFDEVTKQGNYLEAREIVLSIHDQLLIIQSKIEDIPQLLIECQTTVPTQLTEIIEGYHEMIEEGFALEHIQVEKEVKQLKKQVGQYVSLIERTEIDEVNKRIIEVKDNIETLYDLLEKEVIANQFIQKEVNSIEQTLHTLTEQSKDTEEETYYVQQSYHLSEQDIDRQRQIDKQINQLLKRFTLVKSKLSTDNIAYSIIREELEGIAEHIQSVKEQHVQYQDMLQALRRDELHAQEKISVMRKMLYEAQKMVNKSNLPGLPLQYTAQLTETKDSIDTVTRKLQEKPLNMSAINQLLETASKSVEKTYEMTNEMLDRAYLVERVIQYGNRYRSRNSLIADRLQEAEQLFRNYEYDQALEEAAATIERVEPGSLKKIQSFIEEE